MTVAKLCGTNSNKETVMEGFGSGRSVDKPSRRLSSCYVYCVHCYYCRFQILASTDVSAMGCNNTGLDIGVSLGITRY